MRASLPRLSSLLSTALHVRAYISPLSLHTFYFKSADREVTCLPLRLILFMKRKIYRSPVTSGEHVCLVQIMISFTLFVWSKGGRDCTGESPHMHTRADCFILKVTINGDLTISIEHCKALSISLPEIHFGKESERSRIERGSRTALPDHLCASIEITATREEEASRQKVATSVSFITKGGKGPGNIGI